MTATTRALCRDIAAIMPEGVEVEARRPGDATPDVLQAELACVAGSAEVRRNEFCAGRAAARAALTRLGIEDHALLPDADRVPVWPDGIVGSISHTRALCIAVVARTSRWRALGIDLEPDRPLEKRLWRRIMTPRELYRLDEQPEHERGRLARLAFSAKECFYKTQYPLTRGFLGFQDVELELAPSSHRFRAIPRVDLGPALGSIESFDGRWTHAEAHVISVMTLTCAGT